MLLFPFSFFIIIFYHIYVYCKYRNIAQILTLIRINDREIFRYCVFSLLMLRYRCKEKQHILFEESEIETMKNTSEVARKMIELYHETAEKCIDDYGLEWMVDTDINIYYDNVYDTLRAFLVIDEARLLSSRIDEIQRFIEAMNDGRTEIQSVHIKHYFKYICDWKALEIRDDADYSEYAKSILNELVYDLSNEQVAEIFEHDDLIYFLHKYIKYDLDLNEYAECLYDFDSDLSVEERESLSMNAISSAIEKLDEIYSMLES